MELYVKFTTPFICLLSALSFFPHVLIAEEQETKKVMITSSLFKLDVKHDGTTTTIMRNQDKTNEIVPFYRKTARGKIQAMHPFKPHAVDIQRNG